MRFGCDCSVSKNGPQRSKFQHDAIEDRFDPRGLSEICRTFLTEMDARWARLSVKTQAAIRDADLFGIHKPRLFETGDDKVAAFQRWFDQEMIVAVMSGNGSWLHAYSDHVVGLAKERANTLRMMDFSDAGPDDEPRDEHGRWSTEFTAREKDQNIGSEHLSSVTRSGYFYRGMSEAEYEATIGAGKGISSNLSSSIPSAEGTNFSSDVPTAESYANFGRSDPRATGKANYLVEVSGGPDIVVKPDGYYHAKTEIPASRITRVWRMEGEAGSIVAKRLNIGDFNPNHEPGGSPSGGQFAPTGEAAGVDARDVSNAGLPRYLPGRMGSRDAGDDPGYTTTRITPNERQAILKQVTSRALRGVCEHTSKIVTRSFAQGVLNGHPATRIAFDIGSHISKIAREQI